jgi:hypothetical protein
VAILSEVEAQPASAIPPAAAQKIFDRMLNVPCAAQIQAQQFPCRAQLYLLTQAYNCGACRQHQRCKLASAGNGDCDRSRIYGQLSRGRLEGTKG